MHCILLNSLQIFGLVVLVCVSHAIVCISGCPSVCMSRNSLFVLSGIQFLHWSCIYNYLQNILHCRPWC